MRHVRPAGVRAIEALSELGKALGYEVHHEYPVGGRAAVDVAWTSANSHESPLFVFEVESTPSQGIANNALKVLGPASSEVIKPLFFFHLVLQGDEQNRRMQIAQQSFGMHNYQIFRMAGRTGRAGFLTAVFQQHRRLRETISVDAVVEILSSPYWGSDEFHGEMLTAIESLEFKGSFVASYTRLALRDNQFDRLLASRLRAEGDCEDAAGQFDGGPGDYLTGLVAMAFQIYAGEISEADGPGALEQWSKSIPWLERRIDVRLGLSEELDQYVVELAAVEFALAAALLQDRKSSYEWVAQDMWRFVQAQTRSPLHPRYRLVTVLWLAHVIAGAPQGSQVPSYEDLEVLVAEADGIPRLHAHVPPNPFFGDLESMDAWYWETDRVELPTALELTNSPDTRGTDRVVDTDAAHLTLSILLDFHVLWDSAERICRILHAHRSSPDT